MPRTRDRAVKGPARGAQPGYIPTQPRLAKGRELVRLGQSDPVLDQGKEDAQTDERRQADDLLTRTQSDQGQRDNDADDGRKSEEAEVQRRAGQRYAPELEKLTVQAAEYVYSKSQPVRGSYYLQNAGRSEAAIAFCRAALGSASKDDRPTC